MTNHDRADQLLGEAKEIMNELRTSLDRRAHNLVIRRAQEVVELVLKGLLAELGMDYPRVHDVAPQFAEAVRARGLQVEPEMLEWLEATSSRLATLRAPAFYFEIEYDVREAGEAAAAATRVMSFGANLLGRLRRTR